MSLMQAAAVTESMSLRDVLTALGSLVIACLGLAGVIYTARSAKAANLRSADTASWQVQMDALQKRADSWRDDVEALRSDRDEDRALHAQEIAAVRDDLTKVKEEAARDRLARYELVHWARAVVALLRQNGIPFPPPPPGVSDTDPGLARTSGE